MSSTATKQAEDNLASSLSLIIEDAIQAESQLQASKLNLNKILMKLYDSYYRSIPHSFLKEDVFDHIFECFIKAIMQNKKSFGFVWIASEVLSKHNTIAQFKEMDPDTVNSTYLVDSKYRTFLEFFTNLKFTVNIERGCDQMKPEILTVKVIISW